MSIYAIIHKVVEIASTNNSLSKYVRYISRSRLWKEIVERMVRLDKVEYIRNTELGLVY